MSNRPCNHPIELGNNRVTYCVLQEKHEGMCEPPKAPCPTCVAIAKWWRAHGERVGDNVNRPRPS